MSEGDAKPRGRLALLGGFLAAIGAVSWIGPTYGPQIVDHFVGSHATPLTLTASFDDGVYFDGWPLVFSNREQAKVAVASGINSCQAILDASRRAGAADLRTTYLNVVAEGAGSRTSTITGVRAVVVQRRSPASGPLGGCESGGEAGVIPMLLKLDSSDPEALRVVQIGDNAEGTVKGQFFSNHVITLGHDESRTIRIAATTTRDLVEWRLQVTAVVDGKTKTYLLDNHGQPWRTTPDRVRDRAEWLWDTFSNPRKPHLALVKPGG